MLSGDSLVSCRASIAGLCLPRYCLAVSMLIAPCTFQLVILEVPVSFFPDLMFEGEVSVCLLVVS